MKSQQRRQVVIPKENAVFRMDKNGEWHNEHGRFEHPRIIKYFNSAIRKDDQGFYVYQSTDEVEEKVYFPYEETALFVFDLKAKDDNLELLLNTTTTMTLDPAALFEKDDQLYLTGEGGDLIKFSSRALLKISKFLKEDNGQLCLCVGKQQFPIGPADSQ